LNLTQNATANNTLKVNANTGGNVLTDNTTVGNVTTGSINVLANLINILNSWGGDLTHFHLGIINIFNAPAVAKNDQSDPTAAEPVLPENQAIVTNSSEPIALGLGGLGSSNPFVTFSSPSSGSAKVPVKTAVSTSSASSSGSTTSSKVVLADVQLNPAAQVAKAVAAAPFSQPASKSQDDSSSFPIALSLISLGGVAWMGTEILNVIAKRRAIHK
jgi:hypothetical protein